MSADHEITHHDPSEGFDHREPKSGAIALFGIGSILLLILTIVALQAYFNKLWDEAVYDKILSVPSEQLQDLHNRENWNLTHFGYADKKSGQVRIPVDKAMDKLIEESGQGKLFYPAKGYVPKKEEPDADRLAAQGIVPPPAAPEEKKDEKKDEKK